ncbi:MAG: carboxypeptidase-like regulatory domain-containing protein [Gemmatimonadaceae bacterium]
MNKRERAVWPILTLALTACVLPLNVQESGSPVLVGIIRRDDGAPAIGARVAITNDQGRSSCAHTSARTFTDSAGVFRFSPTTRVQRWVMVVPAFERFFNWYGVCAGPADSALELAYVGYVGVHYGGEGAAVDTLNCLQWRWHGRARATCTGPHAEDKVQWGGGWSDARGSGYYRMIAVSHGAQSAESGVYVQWVQRVAAGQAEVVRETIGISLTPDMLSSLTAKLFVESSGVACVDVRTVQRPPHWYSLVDQVHEAKELRGPGDSRTVVSCP